jgi:hypothetical protein
MQIKITYPVTIDDRSILPGEVLDTDAENISNETADGWLANDWAIILTETETKRKAKNVKKPD